MTGIMRFARLVLIVVLLAMCYTGGAAQMSSPRSITVVTKPGAAVWIDGVLFGKSNDDGRLIIRSVPPGNRTLRVRADGFKEVKKPLPVSARGDMTVAVTQPADEAELSFQQAEALKATDRKNAIAAYENAIRLRPRYAEALLELARVRSESGDIEGAVKTITALKRARPRWAEASAVEGRIYKDLDDEKRAVAAFKLAITEGGGYQPEAYTGLGILYKEKAENAAAEGDFASEAINYAEAARYLAVAVRQLTVSADAPVVYQLLGLVYERQKKFTEAIKLYEEFLSIFPDSIEASAVQSFIVQIKKQMSEPE